MRTPLATLTCAALLSLGGVASADVYKCTDSAGRVMYQNFECMDGQMPIIKAAADPAVERKQATQTFVAHIGEQTLPPNYAQMIDARLAQILKDPDSRKIAYQGQTYGGAICGTVNARNSFGGYTGSQPFLAYFVAGVLLHLDIYPENRLQKLHYDEEVEAQLLRRCGVRF